MKKDCLRFDLSCCLPVLVMGCAAAAMASDWPAYRHDNARSARTEEQLAFPLSAQWSFQPRCAPEPAWETPRAEPVEGILELGRTQFDDAYPAVCAGGLVFFGTGVEEKLYALDLSTGDIRWVDRAGAAVRLAPAVAGGRVFYGADDGVVRCLDAATGAGVWARRVGPGPARMLGHGRMISRWPVRTGVLVEGGRIYFGAGIWPAEGVYMEAASAADGKTIWRNDSCGEVPESIMSPQGYLLASKTSLFAPHGRATPGAFDLLTGKYKGPQGFGKTVGGTNSMLCDEVLFTGTEEMLAFHPNSKGKSAWLPGRQAVVAGGITYLATDSELLALSDKKYAKASLDQFALRLPEAEARRGLTSLQRKEKELAQSARSDQAKAVALAEVREKIEDAAGSLEKMETQRVAADRRAEEGVVWRVPSATPEALVLAGSTLIAGGNGKVAAFEASTGKALWSADVDGKARALAVADGRLLVSTSSGRIHCFGPGTAEPGRQVTGPPLPQDPFAEDERTIAAREAAKTILRESGVTRGYCLVLGNETGRLALELAKGSDLRIYAVEPDAAKAAAAQRAWETAGLDGRVSVETGPLDHLTHSDWYANLIVSEAALLGQLDGIPAKEVARTLKPHGGVLFLGQPSNAPGAKLTAEALNRWQAGAPELAGAILSETGGRWLRMRREGLPGAGSWTHLYANAANTACGDDQRVSSPLSLLWYGRPGPLHMISRHRRAASPLTANGVLFVEGENLVSGYDAYNGLPLWEHRFPNTVRELVSHDCSNLASDGNSLFVASGTGCQRLDGSSGRVLGEYAAPGENLPGDRWGYLAVCDGKLFGTRAPSAKGARRLFAFDVASGKLLWERPATEISHPSIAVESGKVFFVDDPAAGSAARSLVGARIEGLQPADAEKWMKKSPQRTVVCLESASGRLLWERSIDLTGGIGGPYWSSLGSMVSQGVLVLFGVYTDGHFWKEFFAGQFESRRIVALDAADSHTLWDRKIAYRIRPLIVGDTLHAEPRAYDLRTGEPRNRINPVTGISEPWQFARPGHHCGLPVAAPELMLFRSGHIAYYDLKGDGGTMHFGGQRTGCWINFVAGNGLVLIPEASSGCMCAFPNQSTVVFKPGEQNRAWAKFSYAGDLTPVRRLALNLGAPGDRKDAGGVPWLGFPRPTGSLVTTLNVDVKGTPGGEYYQFGSDFATVEGTSTPWIYSSGYKGFLRGSIPVLDPGDGVAEYAVRLHFAGLPGEQPGQRVFGIKLQGKTVERQFDPVAAAGGPQRAVVREYRGVRIEGRLEIELFPAGRKFTAANGPLLCGIDIERERVLAVGLALPEVILNRIEPSSRVEVRVGNLWPEPLAGTVRLQVPEGFAVEPAAMDVKLAAGSRQAYSATVTVTRPGLAAGDYALVARLSRTGDLNPSEVSQSIHYLGNIGRAKVPAAEDAVVAASGVPGRGAEMSLMVDGGTAEMGDNAHSIAYLKFPLFAVRAKGRLISAALRITNAGNPSSNGGNICVVDGPWTERNLTYERRPEPGAAVANIGEIQSRESRSMPLKLDLGIRDQLSLAIVPVNTDGVDYLARESGTAAELIIDYEPAAP